MLDNKIDKESFLREWVAALESDKYQQGIISLCKDKKYCCLGVACDIARLPYTEKFTERFYYHARAAIVEANPLWEILGDLGNIPPLKVNGRKKESLAALNDNGMSFKDIATIIRKYYLGEDVSLPEGVREC